MEVLNKKERLYSFIMFLILFLITIGIVISAVYFDYQVPKKELAMLRTENEMMKDEFKFQDKFSQKLEEIKGYTDKLNLQNEEFYYNQQLANQNIVELQGLIPAKEDSLLSNRMYDNVLLAYRELVESQKRVNSLNVDEGELDKLRDENHDYEREIQNLKRDLEVCRIISRSVAQ